MEIIIHKTMPAILAVGFIAFGLKYYFHFQYLKIVRKYPKELTFWEFNNSIFSYFPDTLIAFLPLLLRHKKTDLSKDNFQKAIKLERVMFICLVLFYIGILMIPIGIKLQG